MEVDEPIVPSPPRPIEAVCVCQDISRDARLCPVHGERLRASMLRPPELDGHEWRRFVCADCPEGDAYEVVVPLPLGASRDAGPPFETCPRCESMFGFVSVRL